jgi:hypothetical protein
MWTILKSPLLASADFNNVSAELLAILKNEEVLAVSDDPLGVEAVRCVFFGRNLHSRMPLVPTPARLKLLQACDQWHSSRMSNFLTGSHSKLRPNTKGTA